MLYLFLENYRKEILALAEQKTVKLAGGLSSSVELREGLPLFFDNLVEFLKAKQKSKSEEQIVIGAAHHGGELLRLHYTLSHVVHPYGSMCQAVTEFAKIRAANISAQDFNDLNMCLDLAIASAVSEFQFRSVKAEETREVEHLGFLVHELRNSLSSATIAHEMIKKGIVGTGGSTSQVLENSLTTMRNLIDKSLSEVRMRADPEVQIELFQLNALVDQILLTANIEAEKKSQLIVNEIKNDFELQTDRQLLLSAVANLIQNAVKYTKVGGKIWVRGGSRGNRLILEVEDECGGISPTFIEKLFQPFVSGGIDQGGMGLGLTIVQKAVSFLQGNISVKNVEGKGCSFQVDIPKILIPGFPGRAVSGVSSVQPKN